ncbi:MAG: RNA methyltransferase [Betaproteobacteria bacterium]|nr:RNA methyltransferase [Betaproteobacteria bacterium]
MSPHALLGRVRVVLSHPSHPRNIGAAARAMKTMGLSRLYLVNPLKFPHPEATALAAHSTDILERARVCQSLDEALTGTVFAVASTARVRGLAHEQLSAREAGHRIAVEAARGEVALVMGTEKWGLTTEEVSRCNVLAVIPSSPDFSSLNLAAAVQVFAYEIYQAVAKPAGQRITDLPASHEETEHFLSHLEDVLYQVQFLNDHHPKKIMLRLRRLFARARMEKKEVRILRGVLTEIQKNLRPEALNLSRKD